MLCTQKTLKAAFATDIFTWSTKVAAIKTTKANVFIPWNH